MSVVMTAAMLCSIHRARVMHHVISTFHPMAVGYTCITPISTATRDDYGNQLLHMVHQRDTSAAGMGFDDIRTSDIIARVNTEQRQRQIHTMHTFTLATHPRIGHASPVHRVLSTSRLYDAHVLRHIWQYVYVLEMMPTCVAEAEELERRRAHAHG